VSPSSGTTIVLSGLLLAGALYAPAGAPPQESLKETIKVEAAEVVVDAVVTDRRNRLVGDLTAEDFAIYEDGVLQELVSFEVRRGAPTSSRGIPRPAQEPPGPASETAPPPRTLTIILLDYSTTELPNQRLVREAATKYVRERMQPNELLAVFALGTSLRFLTDFTNDRDVLLATLRTSDVHGAAVAGERTDLNEIAAGRGGLSFALTGVPEPSVSSGPGAAIASGMGGPASAAAEAMALRRIAAQYAVLRSAMEQRQTRGVLTAIRAIALGVRHLEGRKSLVLFSQGFVVPQALWSELQAVVDAANRSQLAIYAIDARGLQTRQLSGALVPRDELTAALGQSEDERNPLAGQERIRAQGGENVFDRASQVGHDLPESALRYLATSTGGFLIRNTNDLFQGLARISEEMQTYYVLTYRPTNPNWDGKFRQVRVEVRHPQLRVRARSGYFAIPAEFELLPPEGYAVVAEWRSTPPGAQLPLFVRAGAFRDSGKSYRIPVVIEAPTSAIGFEKRAGSYQAQFHIVGLVRDMRGRLLTHFGGRTQFTATPAEYEALKPGTISFLQVLNLPGGESYSFEVLVKDLLSGKVGREQSGLYLSEPGEELALSTVLLARDVEKDARAGRQFLSVGGARILPSARCQFRNGENLIFYFDVYNPQPAEHNRTALEVEVFLMREGKRVPLSVPVFRIAEEVAEPRRVTVSRFLQLTGLAPGDYMFVVRVRDTLSGQLRSAHAPLVVTE
jgi:VWFA-related protein